MTDREFDELLRRIMIDAAKADIEEIEAENIPVLPSSHFQREMRKMLKDPLRWAKAKTRPMWKTVLQRVAIFFVICSLSLGSIMAASPTVRAAVIRWVAEWYETGVIFHHFGDDTPKELPEYAISELPMGYNVIEEKCIQMPEYARVHYENDKNDWIVLRYVWLQEGNATIVDYGEDEVQRVTVNGCEGYVFCGEDSDEKFNTITWIDEDMGIQFTVDACLSQSEMLDVARSVSLVSEKSK